MKKIFTLLFSTALLSTAAFAQYGQRDKHDDVIVVYGNHYDKDFGRDDRKFGRGAYIFTAKERDIAINQINREYSYKIQSIQNRFGMSRFQKRRMINNLEAERNEEIAMVWAKFNHKKNKFGDRGRRNDRW